jgi:hypothetical protein
MLSSAKFMRTSWIQACISSSEVFKMIRIMTATLPKLITITVDGELSGEYVRCGRDLCNTSQPRSEDQSASFCVTFPASTRADVLFLPAWRRRAFACVPQEFTAPTSLQKSVEPLRRPAHVRLTYAAKPSMPSARISGTCLGS